MPANVSRRAEERRRNELWFGVDLMGFIFSRYIQCIHQKLYHLTTGDYEDFASIILAARTAFQISVDGNAQFKDWLQSIKR